MVGNAVAVPRNELLHAAHLLRGERRTDRTEHALELSRRHDLLDDGVPEPVPAVLVERSLGVCRRVRVEPGEPARPAPRERGRGDGERRERRRLARPHRHFFFSFLGGLFFFWGRGDWGLLHSSSSRSILDELYTGRASSYLPLTI